MSEDAEQERLLDLALDVLEDEWSSWRRIGTWSPGMTRLVRDPLRNKPMPHAPEIVENATITTIDVRDEDVNALLKRFAMDKVVTALRQELQG